MKELTEIEVTKETVVPFKSMDDTPGGSNLGRAEFEVCMRFFRGRLKEYWVYPRQQRDAENFWHYVGYISDWSGFTITSYQGLADAKVWRILWCPEHKSSMMEIYVPNHASFICLDEYGLSFWRERT